MLPEVVSLEQPEFCICSKIYQSEICAEDWAKRKSGKGLKTIF